MRDAEILGFLPYVTPIMSNRSPVELETKFAPEMLRYSTAEAKEENSVAAAAKEVCAAFILSNAHTQEKPSSGIEMDKPNRGSRAVWQVLAQMSSDLSGSGNSKKSTMQNVRKRDDGLVKRVTGMRMMVYVDRKCKQQRTSACSPATSKREQTTRTFQGSRGSQPCKQWVAASWVSVSGGGPGWRTRIDYDARSFLSFLVYASAAWLALIAPSSPPRSAIRSTLWKSAYLLVGPRNKLTSSGALKRL